jgi:hypothetical protein
MPPKLMNATVTRHAYEAGNHYFTIDTEGQETRVTVYAEGRVGVCVMNAMARLQRAAGGKVFNTCDEAMAAYKTAKTRTAIALAVELAPDFLKVIDSTN